MPPIKWSIIEPSVGIICACLPPSVHLFRELKQRASRSLRRGSSSSSSSSGANIVSDISSGDKNCCRGAQRQHRGPHRLNRLHGKPSAGRMSSFSGTTLPTSDSQPPPPPLSQSSPSSLPSGASRTSSGQECRPPSCPLSVPAPAALRLPTAAAEATTAAAAAATVETASAPNDVCAIYARKSSGRSTYVTSSVYEDAYNFDDAAAVDDVERAPASSYEAPCEAVVELPSTQSWLALPPAYAVK